MDKKFKVQSEKLKVTIQNSKSKILDEIIKRTKEDLDERKKQVPFRVILSTFNKLSVNSAKNLKRSFGQATLRMTNTVSIIAEVKFASPSAGNLGSPEELVSIVKQYEAGGADAISIVTEKHYFKGDPLHVQKIKEAVSLPVLQKDFIIDKYQIYEVAKNGADAILLIARLVDKKTLKNFVQLSKKLGVEPVVEINDAKDLEKALVTDTDIIAVNARDLNSFVVDIDRACELIKRIPRRFVRLGFSGVSSRREVEKYSNAGAQGVLIGTSLMKAKNIKKFILSLRGGTTKQSAKKKIATGSLSPRNDRGVKVKICGVRTLEAAQVAVDAGADYLGFNFVLTSRRYIEPEKVKGIIDHIKGKVKVVGVFQNQELAYVNEIAKILGLDFVQLHGSESVEYCGRVLAPVIKVFSLPANFSVPETLGTMLRYSAPLYLLDREKQGMGDMLDVIKVKAIVEKFQIFVSGGLTPGNIAEVVQKVRPFAVDVAGGVEDEQGNQDLEKIRLFIERVKRIE